MKPLAENPYANVPMDLQLARCALVAFAMGKALLSLPDNLEGTRKDQDALDKTIKWHDKVMAEISTAKINRGNVLALDAKLGKFDKLCVQLPKRWRYVARLWAAVVLLWDARVMCPCVTKTAAWRYLDLASDRFARSLLARFEDAAFAGEKIYLELAW